MSLQLEPFSLHTLLENNLQHLQTQAYAKEIAVIMNCKHERPGQEKGENDLLFIADRIKLNQVIRNLVTNALKYAPAHGTVTINTHVSNDGNGLITEKPSKGLSRHYQQILNGQYEAAGYIVISVVDSGVGKSENQINQLFREGVQFNPNDLQAGQGSGLGLWIAKGIVTSHDGSLQASSGGEGCGTTFSLTLPVFKRIHRSPTILGQGESTSTTTAGLGCKAVSLSDVVINSPIIKDSGDYNESKSDRGISELQSIDLLTESKQSHRFRNVLVTDDSAVNRKMMCGSLESVGFKCFQAADGQECLDIVSKALHDDHERIDLILMDYEMPRMNGPTAAAAIRDMGCDIPVIGVTGNILHEDKEYFLSHGAVRVLQKPLSMLELEEVLSVYRT